MKYLFKKISLQVLAALILVSALLPFFSYPTNAGTYLTLSDTMSRQAVNVNSNHDIKFTLATAIVAGENLTLTFPAPAGAAGFDLSALGTASPLDFDVLVASTNKTVVAAGGCAANDWEVNTITPASGLIKLVLCAGSTSTGSTDTIEILIGTNASFGGAGTHQIKNPTATAQSYKVAVGGSHDTSSFAIPILSADQVTVTASVDPSITSSLSPTTCPMNATLTSGTTGYCAVTNTVSTNAGSGYTSTVVDYDGSNPGKLCSPSPGTCTSSIPASNTTVAYGTSAFGVNTSKTSQTVTNTTPSCGNNTGQNVTSITGTAKQYSSSTGPVSSDAPILCYQATISGSQAAGGYSELSTHITTGNF